MYLMVCTRLDIALTMYKVRRYMLNPWKVHWKGVKWIPMYLKRTKDYVLLFDGSSNNVKSLICYVNANYVHDLDQRKSTIEHVFTLDGGSISWRSTLQSV